MIALAREFSDELKAGVLVDASAALGVAQRQGLGKLRHLQTGALWIQETAEKTPVNAQSTRCGELLGTHDEERVQIIDRETRSSYECEVHGRSS